MGTFIASCVVRILRRLLATHCHNKLPLPLFKKWQRERS